MVALFDSALCHKVIWDSECSQENGPTGHSFEDCLALSKFYFARLKSVSEKWGW